MYYIGCYKSILLDGPLIIVKLERQQQKQPITATENTTIPQSITTM